MRAADAEQRDRRRLRSRPRTPPASGRGQTDDHVARRRRSRESRSSAVRRAADSVRRHVTADPRQRTTRCSTLMPGATWCRHPFGTCRFATDANVTRGRGDRAPHRRRHRARTRLPSRRAAPRSVRQAIELARVSHQRRIAAARGRAPRSRVARVSVGAIADARRREQRRQRRDDSSRRQ